MLDNLPHRKETSGSQELLFIFSPPAGLAEYFAPRYAVYGFSLVYWIDLLSLILLQVLIASVFGLIIYRVIIRPRDFESSKTMILVYGAIIPFWLLMPVYFLRVFGIRNLFMRFATGCLVPIVSIFRATEAAHGFAPEHSTKSEKDYMVYYASLLIISRDEKGDYIKCTWGKVARHGCNFLGFLLILGMYKSIIMLHEDLVVFGPPINSRSEWNSLKRFVTWELYANNMVHAVLFQLYLTTYVEGLTLLWTAISGCQVDEVMKNPMFESRSPSDFWSKRWNLLIHTVLKGGVYKPVRKNGSIALACISVFLASGLFHEFLLAVTFFEGVFIPAYGYTLAFFFWQAALIVGEISFGRSKFFQILGKSLPSTARTVLVISLGLPLAHMFSEPYARSNFFQSGLQGVPTVLAFSD